MAFGQAQYEAVVDKINEGITTVSAKIDEVIPAAEASIDHWYIPGFIKDAVMWLANETVSIAQEIWRTFTELLKGAAAPVIFFSDAWDWDNIHGLASDVAGELSPTVMPSSRHWTGDAQQAYATIVPLQGAAASRIAAVADGTSSALNGCALAGLAFYLTLGLILAQFIIALVGVIAALGSIALSAAGLALAVGETTVGIGLIITAVGGLLTVLTTQSNEMVALHGQAVDNSAFPGGRWPDPYTATYGHAS